MNLEIKKLSDIGTSYPNESKQAVLYKINSTACFVNT
jgi:hypothetical protein